MYGYNLIKNKYIDFVVISYSPFIGFKKTYNDDIELTDELINQKLFLEKIYSDVNLSEIYIGGISYLGLIDTLEINNIKDKFIKYIDLYENKYTKLIKGYVNLYTYAINTIEKDITIYLLFDKIETLLKYHNEIFRKKKYR